jgi:glycosyltransferase involved in cell wall biosynthesis
VTASDALLQTGISPPATDGVRVGIVLPVCNGAQTIRAAIESVQRQTYRHWRLYVVIDRSSDDTVRIVDECADGDPRIVKIEKLQREGLAAALNLGWRTASEPLIARADADDLCLPQRFERQVAFLDAHLDVAVLGTGCLLVRDDGTPVGEHRRPAEHAVLAARILRECPFMHPSVMMRRSFLETLNGYDPSQRVAEDYDLWLRGVSAHRYANLQDLLVQYTVSNASASTRWAHTTGAAGVIFRNGRALDRGVEGAAYAVRYVVAGALTRLGIKRRRL